MATRLLERVPVDRIGERAQPVDVGRLLILAAVGVFYLLGWLAGKLVTVLGVLLGWVVAAVVTGWQDARPPARAEGRKRGRLA